MYSQFVTTCKNNLYSRKASKEKFIILGKSVRPKYCLTVGSINVKELDPAELLEITIDNQLGFNQLIESLCRNLIYKLHVVTKPLISGIFHQHL